MGFKTKSPLITPPLPHFDTRSGKDDRCEWVGCSLLAVETASYKMINVFIGMV